MKPARLIKYGLVIALTLGALIGLSYIVVVLWAVYLLGKGWVWN